ncbi:hypothetical protein V1477_003395 [Vespula maculifrons]|uniref:Uncharacterized protein n=1 Tax=Vespula maculifrons TaxID=7453 RepID=A0ABD2CUE3_VESMC
MFNQGLTKQPAKSGSFLSKLLFLCIVNDSSDQEGIEYRLQRDSNMDQFHDLDGKHLFRIDSIIIAIQSVESHRHQNNYFIEKHLSISKIENSLACVSWETVAKDQETKAAANLLKQSTNQLKINEINQATRLLLIEHAQETSFTKLLVIIVTVNKSLMNNNLGKNYHLNTSFLFTELCL